MSKTAINEKILVTGICRVYRDASLSVSIERWV